MKKYFYGAAMLLLASGLHAQTINILLQDEETATPTAGSYNDFSNTDDMDPNGLVKLSTGSFVFFESEGTANPPAGNTADGSGDTGDYLVLFDPDDAGGGVSRFEVILPEQGATSFNSVLGITTIDIRVSDIVRNSNDDLYVAVADADAPAPIPHYIIKLPSTGPDTYGAPILVADETRVGSSALASQVDLALKEDSGDTIFFVIDDEGADAAAANDANLFVYSLPGSATNTTAPTALLNSDFSTLMTTLGGIGGTDKTDVDNLEYLPTTDQLLVSNGGNTTADVARGDIALYDLGTNTYSAWLDASTRPGTPISSVVIHNPSNSSVGVWWFVGAGSSSGPALENDRIDLHALDGTYLSTVVTENDIQAVDSNIGDLNQFSSAMDIDSAGNYYILHGGDPESIIETIPASAISEWLDY